MDLESVFRSYQKDVFTYFLRVTGKRGDAEELAQETFFRACTAALRFRGDSAIRTWLLGIARRVWLETVRKTREDALADLPEKVLAPPDHEERMDVERALASLTDEDRELLTLIDVIGVPALETSRLLAISSEALRVRLHRARTRLREAYLR